MPARCDGLLLLDKPEGPTSHDVVARVKRASSEPRVGHAGTLDPMASGLLPLVLGRATRLVRFLPDSPKTYRGTLRLGLTSNTDDVTGEVLSRHEGGLPDSARVLAAARKLEGRGPQVPPAFSARKVEGRRMYELARKGVSVSGTPVEVDVHRFELVPTDQPDRYSFTAEVSSGTYIRALARDLGQMLGCGAVLASLIRTRIGPMRLEDALAEPLPELDRRRILAALIPLESMPLVPPVLQLSDPDQARRFSQGAAVRIHDGPPAEGLLRVQHPSGKLLGVAEGRAGLLHPRVVLNRE